MQSVGAADDVVAVFSDHTHTGLDFATATADQSRFLILPSNLLSQLLCL